ncbi:unnamed protein product [Rhizophagus irregularis]|nr:unnamed protein product [Rhizophagus irregularis]
MTLLFINEIESNNEPTNESLKIFDTDDFDNENMVLEPSLKFIFRRRLAEVPVEYSIKVVRKISWECSCAGKYHPKKIIYPRNHQSKCTNE